MVFTTANSPGELLVEVAGTLAWSIKAKEQSQQATKLMGREVRETFPRKLVRRTRQNVV